MSTIDITPTAKTPSITLNSEKGVLEIKGRSIPENSIEFYKPLLDKLAEYESNGGKAITTNIYLEYFNTSSSKCLLDVFKKLENIQKKGGQVTVNWYYEEDDEDMQEAGEDYKAILQLPFNINKIDAN